MTAKFVSASEQTAAEMQSLCLPCAEHVAGASDVIALKPYDAQPSSLAALFVYHRQALTVTACARCAKMAETARVTFRRK